MQIIVNGLISGSSIALMALAFAMVYLPAKVFHIALGGIYALSPYVVMAAIRVGCPWPLAVAAAIVCGSIISLLCEVVNHWPLEQKRAGTGVHLVSSLGIYILLVEGAAMIWGAEAQTLRKGVDDVFLAGNVLITRSQLMTGVISILLTAMFAFWLRCTPRGLRLRALADNPVELALRGYNIRRLRLLCFWLSGALCSVASLLAAFDLGFDPHVGFSALLVAVAACIVGGRDSYFGPLVGGILLGIIRAGVVWFLSARWQDAVTFLILVAFLLVRSHGLLGKSRRLEAVP